MLSKMARRAQIEQAWEIYVSLLAPVSRLHRCCHSVLDSAGMHHLKRSKVPSTDRDIWLAHDRDMQLTEARAHLKIELCLCQVWDWIAVWPHTEMALDVELRMVGAEAIVGLRACAQGACIRALPHLELQGSMMLQQSTSAALSQISQMPVACAAGISGALSIACCTAEQVASCSLVRYHSRRVGQVTGMSSGNSISIRLADLWGRQSCAASPACGSSAPLGYTAAAHSPAPRRKRRPHSSCLQLCQSRCRDSPAPQSDRIVGLC